MAIRAISLAAQVCQHVVAAAALALGPQGGQVDQGGDDLLAGPRVGLGEDAALVIDHHAAAGPGERRVVLGAGPLVGRHHIGQVVQALAAIGEELRVRRAVVQGLEQLEQHAAELAEGDPQLERNRLAVH